MPENAGDRLAGSLTIFISSHHPNDLYEWLRVFVGDGKVYLQVCIGKYYFFRVILKRSL